jgi:hypothetical protein
MAAVKIMVASNRDKNWTEADSLKLTDAYKDVQETMNSNRGSEHFNIFRVRF